MKRALLLSGGPSHAHDFSASSRALANVLSEAGFACTVLHEPDEAAAQLPGGFDLLVVNALRWRMLDPRYDAWRADWGYHTPQTTRDSIASFVASGGGLLGSHTASICFDDWPEWGDILGGAWHWGRSSHPPVGPVEATVVPGAAAGHPVTADITSPLRLVDEIYGDQDLRTDLEVLMVARRSDDDTDQPVLWTHRYGRGRVVYDGFGHDATSILDPTHAAILQRSAHWVTETPS